MTDRNKTLSAGDWNKLVEAVVAAQKKYSGIVYDADTAGHTAARIELDNARAELRQALKTAEYGQTGAAHVRYWWKSPSTRWHFTGVSVSINGRLRAWMEHHSNKVQVASKAKAEERYQDDAAARVEAEERYRIGLQEVADLLYEKNVQKVGGKIPGWTYVPRHDGNPGDYIPSSPDREGGWVAVSARGAMRRAWGADWQEQSRSRDVAVEAEWDRKLHGARF